MRDAMTLLEQLPGSLGRARTARKSWTCTCHAEYRRWEVKAGAPLAGGGSSMSTRSCSTREEAEAAAVELIGKVSNVNADTGQPVAWYETAEVVGNRNPNYRADCLGLIPPGGRYFEYLGEAMAFESGIRYCRRCAVSVWGSGDKLDRHIFTTLCDEARVAPDTTLTDAEIAARWNAQVSGTITDDIVELVRADFWKRLNAAPSVPLGKALQL